jgi:hypothetical protein
MKKIMKFRKPPPKREPYLTKTTQQLLGKHLFLLDSFRKKLLQRYQTAMQQAKQKDLVEVLVVSEKKL